MIGVQNVNNNEKIREYSDNDGFEYPKFWVDDKVQLYLHSKEIVKSTDYGKKIYYAWQADADGFIKQNINKTVTIIEKHKANHEQPWWSLLINDQGNKCYFLDMCIYKKPHYRPRKLNK